jgi:hypothetical protein
LMPMFDETDTFGHVQSSETGELRFVARTLDPFQTAALLG